MEVSVLDADGLPGGSLLSVRAGNTRRQAPVPLYEPLRFPTSPLTARNLKVDILQTLGTARLDLDGRGESKPYTVAIDMGFGERARVNLAIREDPRLCGKRAAELRMMERAAASAARSEVSADADETASGYSYAHSHAAAAEKRTPSSEYARQHNIPESVKEMLQYVLRERPDAPFSCMADYMRRQASLAGEVAVADAVLPDSPVSKQRPLLMHARPPPSFETDPQDEERWRLEEEHFELLAERSRLMQELSALDSAMLGGVTST